MKAMSFSGDLDSFAEYFMNDLRMIFFKSKNYFFNKYFYIFIILTVLFCPFFSHILDAWSKRNHPNLLFLFYEDYWNKLAQN